jgi:shikimate dehydrogenase
MNSSSELKVVAIYGFPISHSLSRVMQNSGFEKLGLDYTYIAFKVEPADLEDAVTALKALNFKGANITVPHKEEVLDYLDEVTENAFLIGAVNVIENARGRLIGYNTDCIGFIKALKEAGISDINKTKALIIGAGGASKAACVGLLREKVKHLVVANRTERKAQLLRDNFKKRFTKAKISICPMKKEDLKKEFESADLLVNTTSVGMKNDSLDLPLESLKKGALVYDMIYNPPKTRLLKKAEKLGYKIENGLNMLLYQGTEAFKIWTKEKAPTDIMKEALFKAVSKK